MKITISTVLAAAATIAPASSTFAASHTSTTASHARTVTATRSIKGPSVDMRWGPVQVTIILKANRVVGLSATAPTERPRSAFINSQAIPMLRQEVLQARTVAGIKNIYSISGATMTSDAFYQSLLAALHTAHLL